MINSKTYDLPGGAGTALVLPSPYHIVVRKGLQPFKCVECIGPCRTPFDCRPISEFHNVWGEWLQFAGAEPFLTFLQILLVCVRSLRDTEGLVAYRGPT